ncbi:poly-gamma-glutamate hydrolase family protein [Streptomyces sp. NPDC014724]|uniref:poly-gamma-glutamate hydrolase family protein n=1 Tax=unclassified Streptomyces TaxID=2593676 RepID=UPI0037015831
MADTYSNFAQLAAAEQEGTAWRRAAVAPAGATWAATAIHGGGIEGGSGEMAREISLGGSAMAYYEFAGLKASNNTTLHITSTRFDEPMGQSLVAGVRRCLSFHGYVGTDGVPETAIGGLDADVVARLTDSLTRAGFLVTTAPSEIAGRWAQTRSRRAVAISSHSPPVLPTRTTAIWPASSSRPRRR